MGANQIRIYNDSNTPLIHNMNWMKDIPDETKISEMTIPGTHDSCALFGICCARTQTWTLVEQMKAGIRYFDIRLRRINDTLRAYHAFVDQKETFDRILAYTFDFLEKNPTETILMEICSEYEPKNCTKSFVDLYDEYTRPYSDKIASYENKDIELGKIRGKLLAIKVFEGRTSSIPNFFIQNEWTVNIRCHINNKKRRIKENIHRAISINNNKIFLNYISASSDYAMMTPYTAATKCNAVAMKYHGRLGIVVTDYPGEDLIKHLIKQNNISPGIKEEIKNNDLVYVIHNDTHKYLFLDKNGKKDNNIYCVKEKEKLTIRHKNQEIGRDNFKIGDEFILSNKDGFELEFRIGGTFSGNEDFIDNQSLLLLQYNKNDEMEYIECKYENKNSKKHYLLNFTKKNGTYTYYFKIEKAKEEEDVKE
jgi:hypothetical protein